MRIGCDDVASVILEGVSIEIPAFNATSRSFTSKLLNVATGGRLDADSRGRVRVAALTDVNLRFEDGDRVGVVGPNGAGKSTLLRTLAKVYEPTKGNAHIDGKVISLIDLALGINPEASGSENLFIRGRLLGLTRKEIFKKHDDIVAFSELGEYMHMPVRTYSSGMLLRLAFSVSTAVNPEILLMDEWLSVGDADFRGKAEARLSGLVAKTRILVIASHSRELIEQVCNRAIWVEHGAVKMDGPVQSVCDAYFG